MRQQSGKKKFKSHWNYGLASYIAKGGKDLLVILNVRGDKGLKSSFFAGT